MQPPVATDRRRYRRYIVRGRVRFRIDLLEVWADLVNFGYGGMLIRSRFLPPEEEELTLRVLTFRYPESFDVRGRVVGGKQDLLAIQFLNRSEGVEELLHWLERENYPWTGGDSQQEITEPKAAPVPAQEPARELSRAEFEALLERIFQDA